MSFTYKTVSTEYRIQLKEKGSSFITYLFPIKNEIDFKKRASELKIEFPDASHHCFAFRLDDSGNADRSSDDGEPSGTAGKPILNQLLSHQLSYSAIIVIRYFGGTKLGTGGLIKAYKSAAKAVIESAMIIEEKEKVDYKISFAFELTSEINKLIKSSEAEILEKEADEKLHLRVRFPKENINKVDEKLTNLRIEFTLDPQ